MQLLQLVYRGLQWSLPRGPQQRRPTRFKERRALPRLPEKQAYELNTPVSKERLADFAFRRMLLACSRFGSDWP